MVRAGRWLTKRRGILLAPLFVTALIAARWAPAPHWEAAQDLAALLCLLGGTWLRVTASSYHDSSQDAQPLTAGPYAWIRHPLYAANFLLGFGIVLAAGWWPMILVYVLFYVPLHAVIARAEELHLTALYGPVYERYRRAVPAFLPRRPFQGPRYGERSRYKMEHAQEGLKAVGYLAGLLALLALKEWRSRAVFPAMPHLPPPAVLAAAALAMWAIAFRAKMRWAWVRSLQTVVAVTAVVALAVQVPGVWITSRPASLMTAITAEKPAAAPMPETAAPSIQSAKIDRLQEAKPAPADSGVWDWLDRQLWSHFEIIAGLGAFGISALSEGTDEGGASARRHEFGEAGLTGAVSVVIAALVKRWHDLRGGALSHPAETPWRTFVQPVVEKDRVGLVTVVKRRF